jgi:hypothetical protein
VRTDFIFGFATALTKVKMTAVMLTVIWNCRNLRTASFTARPHIMAVRMEAKLSSRRIMAEASLATSVPAIPMENPISADLSAGPSFVPVQFC